MPALRQYTNKCHILESRFYPASIYRYTYIGAISCIPKALYDGAVGWCTGAPVAQAGSNDSNRLVQAAALIDSFVGEVKRFEHPSKIYQQNDRAGELAVAGTK